MVRKEVFLLVFLVFGFLLFSSGAQALQANFTLVSNPNILINLAENNTINVTIGAVDENITQIVFYYQTNVAGSPIAYAYVNDTNATSATSSTFLDNTNYSVTPTRTYILVFANTTAAGIVPNSTTRNFLFTVGAPPFASSLLTLTVNATGISKTTNATTYSFQSAFAFVGYVKNETGCTDCYQNATNASIYGIIFSPNAPPTSILLTSALTNASGYFRLAQINGSALFSGYELKLIYYNASGTATKVGPILPQFPSIMFYSPGGEGFDMTLNGGTFYLQPATTIFIKAHNGTTAVSFGYMLIDQILGFPIDTNVLTSVVNKTLIVPANRGYTVSFFRMFKFPGSPNSGYLLDNNICGGTDFMNDSHCPAPPKSASITIAQAAAEATVTINQSLVVRRAYVHGCINIAAGTNNSAVNITNIKVNLLPWTTDSGSFIPPFNADDGSINVTKDINYSRPGCFAYYNVSLLNNTGYMLEFYAKNASGDAGNPGTANNLGGFLNFTSSDFPQINLTLYNLVGTYRNTSAAGVLLNTSSLRINIVNSTGGYVTTSTNANLKVKNTAALIGSVYYIIDSNNIVNGSFYIPILNNSNYAKIMIFSQNGPPKETKINLTLSEINITVTSMGIDKGFRKLHPNGSLAGVDTDDIPIQLRFLRTGGLCDLPYAPDSCVITTLNASNFNPLKALLAGRINMEVRITATNVSLIFHDYDMLSAKQPPMDSVLDQNASDKDTVAGSTSVQETWNFGSFAPVDSYKNVTIVIPYSDSSSASNYINDSSQVNISIPILYDENQKATYNATSGYGTINLTDDFFEYNNTYYDDLINVSGVICNSTTYNVCNLNTSSNYIALRIPHFSTVGALISGSATLAPSGGGGSGSSSGGGGGGGGVGGGGSTNKSKTEAFTFVKVTPGAASIIRIVNPEIGLKEIQIFVNNPATTVKITVTKLDGMPAVIRHEINNSVVYKYFEINKTNLKDSDIQEAKFTVNVEKSYLDTNKYNRNKVAVLRYSEANGWSKLNTVLSLEDDKYIYYNTTTPGFSIFAITVEKEAQPTQEQATQQETTPPQSEPTVSVPTKNKYLIWMWFVVVIVTAAIVVALVLFMRKKKSKKK